ncbi:MAG: hypothetical protein QM682_01190 [Paracoccus sp. (in: a-proteobacteria)]|uniref:hypothetical protein n=1 Tax=Paracoccus sp. TaxID=267 RepID=UPI0039E522AF
MKHIADKPHRTSAGRILNFIRQDRESGLHPAVAALHARPRRDEAKADHRMQEFTRIERGRTA